MFPGAGKAKQKRGDLSIIRYWFKQGLERAGRFRAQHGCEHGRSMGIGDSNIEVGGAMCPNARIPIQGQCEAKIFRRQDGFECFDDIEWVSTHGHYIQHYYSNIIIIIIYHPLLFLLLV